MMDHEEAYRYTNYIQKLQGSKINVLPPKITPISNSSITDSPYANASLFMETESNNAGGFDDLIKQKKELSEDKVSLIPFTRVWVDSS